MYVISKQDNVINVLEYETKKESKFNAITGEKISGDLDIPPDKVLYMEYCQTQLTISKQVKEKWKKRK